MRNLPSFFGLFQLMGKPLLGRGAMSGLSVYPEEQVISGRADYMVAAPISMRSNTLEMPFRFMPNWTILLVELPLYHQKCGEKCGGRESIYRNKFSKIK